MEGKERVAVIGHSFVRRLANCFPKTFSDNYDLKECSVSHRGLGGLQACSGGSVSKSVGHFKGKYHQFLLHHRPSVVIIQLGENDLDSDKEGLVIAITLEEIGCMLTNIYHVRKVVICELFPRKSTRNVSSEGYEAKRVLTNNILRTMLDHHKDIRFWKHKRTFETQTPIFAEDGVHLGSFGQRRFYRSIRHAIMTAYRLLKE